MGKTWKSKAREKVACSRLRDSRARGIEKTRTKTGGNFFSPPRPHFRAPFTFASSPLSESLEQASEKGVGREKGKRKKFPLVYFRVCTFSIPWNLLSRSLEQANASAMKYFY